MFSLSVRLLARTTFFNLLKLFSNVPVILLRTTSSISALLKESRNCGSEMVLLSFKCFAHRTFNILCLGISRPSIPLCKSCRFQVCAKAATDCGVISQARLNSVSDASFIPIGSCSPFLASESSLSGVEDEMPVVITQS